MRSILELRLYVAGDAPNSQRALSNLRALLAAHPDRAVRLQVVDVLRHPRRGLDEGVVVTPTLVRLAPEPRRRIIGDLRDAELVSTTLELGGGTGV